MLKSVAVGIATGLIAAVIWTIAALVLPLLMPLVASWLDPDAGVGGSSSSVSSGSILGATMLGFAAGFLWSLRRGDSHA